MKLYHGSKTEIKYLEKRQAQQGSVDVPRDELLDAIYLTPDYGFAVAVAARPDGETKIDDIKHRITFEKPKLFNPDENLFIYTVDSEEFPIENIKHVDDLQYAVFGINRISFTSSEMIKARKLLDYYELTNWKEGNELNNEIGNTFKMR